MNYQSNEFPETPIIPHLQELRRLDQLISVHAVREHVLEEVINVSNHHSHHINDNGVTQDDGESQENVRQIRSFEFKDTEEVHPDQGIPSRPHVDEHYGKGLAQEQHMNKGAE